MRLVGLDCFGYELRYAHGEYVMSGGRAATSQVGTLVRLRTDEGMDGWGEITPLGPGLGIDVDTSVLGEPLFSVQA